MGSLGAGKFDVSIGLAECGLDGCEAPIPVEDAVTMSLPACRGKLVQCVNYYWKD